MRNIEAISEVMQMTRTSLGPNGMNKFIINHIDKLILTKDSGIMMKELDVNHPAARLVVHAIRQQQEEQGDSTNFVVKYFVFNYFLGNFIRGVINPSKKSYNFWTTSS